MTKDDQVYYRHALGMALREIRRRRGYSQEKVAAGVGTTRGHMSSMELGHGDPKFSTLLRLSEVLNVDIVGLMRETDKHYKTIVQEIISREHIENVDRLFKKG